jgi:hypothetical protein
MNWGVICVDPTFVCWRVSYICVVIYKKLFINAQQVPSSFNMYVKAIKQPKSHNMKIWYYDPLKFQINLIFFNYMNLGRFMHRIA